MTASSTWPGRAEAGVPGYEVTAWFGLVAPAGTSPEIIRRLNKSVQKSLATLEVIDAAAKQGLNTRGSTPEQFTVEIEKEIARWSKLVQATGFKLQ